jgi:hypothetical protein
MEISKAEKGEIQLLLQELKKGKNIIAILLLIFLLTIPLYNNIYHSGLYYIIVGIILAPPTFYRIMRSNLLEKRFYHKWSEKRKKGRLINTLSEGMKAIISMAAMVFGGQYIVTGRTPSYILSEVPINVSIGLMFFLLIWGAICGIIAWYEKEKRFSKISLNKIRK